MSKAFRHVDHERTIFFGVGALDDAGDLLGDTFTLLTTPRAADSAPGLVKRAAAVVHVPAGPVDVVAAELREDVSGGKLVALGGGRVIDVAKALAAADGPREVAAILTSLAGAEMTGVHRHARGVADSTPKVRPSLVINDPELSASQPIDQLAASSANALGHAITALVSERSTATARAVAAQAITALGTGWLGEAPDRGEVALGALLAGWAVDQSGLGPHHARPSASSIASKFALTVSLCSAPPRQTLSQALSVTDEIADARCPAAGSAGRSRGCRCSRGSAAQRRHERGDRPDSRAREPAVISSVPIRSSRCDSGLATARSRWRESGVGPGRRGFVPCADFAALAAPRITPPAGGATNVEAVPKRRSRRKMPTHPGCRGPWL
jgi:hypothetical protein